MPKEYEPKQSFAVIIAESGILEEQLSPLKGKGLDWRDEKANANIKSKTCIMCFR